MRYKGTDIKKHNLQLKKKAFKFLSDKNIAIQQIPDLIKNKMLATNNNSSNQRPINQMPKERLVQKHVERLNEEQDSDEDSQLNNIIAKYKKVSNEGCSNSNYHKQASSFNPKAKNNSTVYDNENFQRQSKTRLEVDFRSSFQRYSEEHSKKMPTLEIKREESRKQPKNNKKAKGVKNQSIINQRQTSIQQIGQIYQLLDINNKFTLASLKDMSQPLTKNYRIGNKDQWESNPKIKDYELKFVLRKFPKIKDFKNNQKAIIKCSLLKNDVFVCMPTGGGKSLTFQLMTFIEKGVYLCILPLVSLIMDQQFHAKNFGIKAFSLTGAKEIADNKKIYNEISNYQVGTQSIVIFCTPQKINKSPQFISVIQKAYQDKYLVKIVIDQVHCVSTWGKQFRQDYENLSLLRAKFPQTPILGLTATVTEYIKQDIITRLGIQNCYYFQSSFNRVNLYYEVREKKKTVLNQIISIIEEYRNQSGIIYCLSRKQCQQMSKQLQSRKYKVAFYHAQISESQKKMIQEAWMVNQIQIIIATIAFGMGINKPDVKFVIHHSLSKSLENYYQESGRAGRDGQDAKCILFYKKSDKISLQSLIMKNQLSDNENKNFCMKQLSNMIKYCEDKYTCRRKFQLQYLGQTNFDPKQCAKTCDNCKKNISYYQIDVIRQAKRLVELMIEVQRMRQTLSQNQIILLCKGSADKSFRYKSEQIERNINVGEIRELFAKWNKQQIDELITELCSNEIFYEKIVKVNTFKNNVVSNVYLKVNFTMANRFLKRVEILPMKRLKLKNFHARQNTPVEISDYQFDFQETNNGEGFNTEKQEDEQGEGAQNQSFQEEKYSYKMN